MRQPLSPFDGLFQMESLAAYLAEIRLTPASVEIGKPQILRHTVVGQIVPQRQHLADRLQIPEAELVAGRYVVSFVPLVPVVDHEDPSAPCSFRQCLRHFPHASDHAPETVRAEIEKGKGTQFDPEFADIMLTMIDEDTEYDMREKDEEE